MFIFSRTLQVCLYSPLKEMTLISDSPFGFVAKNTLFQLEKIENLIFADFDKKC